MNTTQQARDWTPPRTCRSDSERRVVYHTEKCSARPRKRRASCILGCHIPCRTTDAFFPCPRQLSLWDGRQGGGEVASMDVPAARQARAVIQKSSHRRESGEAVFLSCIKELKEVSAELLPLAPPCGVLVTRRCVALPESTAE